MPTVQSHCCLLCLVGLRWLPASAQLCQQDQPKNKLRSGIIESLLWWSVQIRSLSIDKGYVNLYQQFDSIGREV